MTKESLEMLNEEDSARVQAIENEFIKIACTYNRKDMIIALTYFTAQCLHIIPVDYSTYCRELLKVYDHMLQFRAEVKTESVQPSACP